jgi:hypothetical protein
MRGGDRSSKRARGESRLNEATILRAYLTGKSLREIAGEIGLSLRGTQAAYSRALTHGVAMPEVATLRREAIGRLEILRRRLFDDFDNASDAETRCGVSDRIVRIEQRYAALTGIDVPTRFSVGLHPDTSGDDEITVARLKENLSVDELRAYVALGRKAIGKTSVETTATVTPEPAEQAPANPPAPPIDDPEPDDEPPPLAARPNLHDLTASATGRAFQVIAPVAPAPAIGETPAEQRERTVKPHASSWDAEINALYTQRGMLDGPSDPNWVTRGAVPRHSRIRMVPDWAIRVWGFFDAPVAVSSTARASRREVEGLRPP